MCAWSSWIVTCSCPACDLWCVKVWLKRWSWQVIGVFHGYFTLEMMWDLSLCIPYLRCFPLQIMDVTRDIMNMYRLWEAFEPTKDMPPILQKLRERKCNSVNRSMPAAHEEIIVADWDTVSGSSAGLLSWVLRQNWAALALHVQRNCLHQIECQRAWFSPSPLLFTPSSWLSATGVQSLARWSVSYLLSCQLDISDQLGSFWTWVTQQKVMTLCYAVQ